MMRITSFFVAVCLLASAADAASTVADAAKRGDRDAVRAALARKADVNEPQVDGSTALHWAVERDDLEMADLLIEPGRASRLRPAKGSRRFSSPRSTAARDDRPAAEGRGRSRTRR
jgi:ankyrin repeat protein